VHASDVAKRVRVAVKWTSFADYRCGSLSRAICTGLGRSNVCGHCFRLQKQRALGLYKPCPRQAPFVGPGVSLGNAVCVMLLGGIWLTPAMPMVTVRPCCSSVRLLSGCFVDVDATRIFFAAPRPLTALSAALSALANCIARPL
jgi:hypothetical protein